MLANAEVEIPAAAIAGLKVACAIESERGFIRWTKVRQAPMSQGIFCASTFKTFPEASRPANPLASAGKTGRLRSQPAGKFPSLHQIDFGGELGIFGAVS